MLNIHTLTLGDYGTNCYIVHDSASETCCVIDPGYTPEKVLDEAVRRILRDRGSDSADPRAL